MIKALLLTKLLCNYIFDLKNYIFFGQIVIYWIP